ncbi:TrmB family transcriptional regulator [Paenibacillus lutrae]|uniref:TrmB family transcriptional regulator n=1 Tax=Paenibacillus lutrae TaxID=2078573 RepID=A0A7X3K196_9BACL|nr:TrmB family transcriptional regulator [Paenibacillus lutrae]MVP01885.1 TrmB family transcriptional regulator [Paenibacillus lutrae]
MLQKFGFSQYESQVYESLIGHASLDATSIVNYSSVPKAKIYEVLNRLADKGLVLNTMSGKKKLYSAVPLDTVIKKLTAEFERDIALLKTHETTTPPTNDYVWNLKDDLSILANIAQLIEGATASIRISAWSSQMEQYLPLLEKKEQEGVEVEALSIGSLSTTLRNVHTLQPSEDHDQLEPSQLVVVDQACLIFAQMDVTAWKAIKTMSPQLVNVFTDYFFHDVALAYITKQFHEELIHHEDLNRLLKRLRY